MAAGDDSKKKSPGRPPVRAQGQPNADQRLTLENNLRALKLQLATAGVAAVTRGEVSDQIKIARLSVAVWTVELALARSTTESNKAAEQLNAAQRSLRYLLKDDYADQLRDLVEKLDEETGDATGLGDL